MGNGERVLLVDDEEGLSNVLQRMLESLGYRVDLRTSSEEALQAFASDPDSYDVLVTDMTMPHITGLELARQVRRIRPRKPVVLCTGFSELVDKEKAESEGIGCLVMKPVVRRDMATAVKKAMDRGSEHPSGGG